MDNDEILKDAKRYVFWNNKGGVGKTTLCFLTACEYAERNANENVYIIDLCPQANISEIILNSKLRTGKNNRDELENQITERHTIANYFDVRLENQSTTGQEWKYAIKCNEYSEELPENLYLICGDPELETQVSGLEAFTIIPTRNTIDMYLKVHFYVLDMIENIIKKNKNDNKKAVFFIDTNPSFAIYTRLAILSGNLLIVPCSPDNSSVRGLNNVFKLIYGETLLKGRRYKEEKRDFSYKIKEYEKDGKINIPKIHSIILNMTTRKDNHIAYAFDSVYTNMKTLVEEITKNRENHIIKDQKELFKEIQDFHSVCIIISNFALPISKLKQSKYQIGDREIEVSLERRDNYREQISRIVDTL